jgi:hypothetical protein
LTSALPFSFSYIKRERERGKEREREQNFFIAQILRNFFVIFLASKQKKDKKFFVNKKDVSEKSDLTLSHKWRHDNQHNDTQHNGFPYQVMLC